MAIVTPSTVKGLRLFSGIDTFRQHDDARDSKLNGAYYHQNERLSATEFEEVLDALRYTIETLKTVSGTPINLNLSYLADVTISGVANSDVLGWNQSTGTWTPRTNTSSDEKVKASNDPLDSAGYLSEKVDNIGIQVHQNKLQLVNSGISLSKIQNIGDDTLLGSSIGGSVQQLNLTSTNGVTTTFSGSQISINTPQDLRDSASPTFSRVTLNNAINGLFLNHLNTVSGVSITAAESGKGFSNREATALCEHTLPNAAQGIMYHFHVRDTDGIRIRLPSNCQLQYGSQTTSVAGYIESTTVGSSLMVFGIDSVWYQAIGVGTWVTDTP